MVKRQEYQKPLEQRVLSFIREHHLVSNKCHLLVAVSGGPDSVCLLHILMGLQEELGIKLNVAHLNHQLRGVESEDDARYVSHLARKLGIPATIGARDVKAYQAQQRISLEEAAREVRYTFLAEVARSTGTDCVAVGHTTDDNIETILMHLIRGTGTRGLRGLQPNSQWSSPEISLIVIRPLLQISRQETVEYCHKHQLKPRFDTSNLSPSPLRNRVRHQLLPQLQSYNPRVAEALLRTAHIAGDDLAVLDNEVARLWNSIARRQETTIVLDKEKLLELPPALQRYLLRSAIERMLGNLKDIEARHIEEIMGVLTKPAGKRLSLPGNLVFIIEYDRYLLAPESSALSPFPVIDNETVLKIPGETSFPGWRVAASIIERERMREKDNNFTAYLNLDKINGKVVMRPRRRGDRFQPLGMSQPKKLGEFMIDAKIPRAWRQYVPVVCSSQHIMWVVGWRIDDRVKVTENTEKILCLDFDRVPDTRDEGQIEK